MTSDTMIELAAEVEEIRSGLAALQERFERVMTEVRDLPGGEMVWQRVDAYPGVRLDRDMGAGVHADGWLTEVADFLDGRRGPSSSGGVTARPAGPRATPWPCGAHRRAV